MKRIMLLLITFMLIFTLTACSGGQVVSASQAIEVQNSVTEAAAASVETSTEAAEDAGAQAENGETQDNPEDYTWDEAAVIPIVLNGGAITVEGEGVEVDGSTATIVSAGSYSLSGSLTDGQIRVDSEDEGVVRIILNGVDLRNTTSAPIYILNAEKTVIVLAESSENRVTDGESYIFENLEEDEPNAAIFSKGNLTIYGDGALTVNGNYNDGIASKDGLVIASGTIVVNSVDDGVRGKDYVVVENGDLTIKAQGDGLKSDNEEDASKGTVSIEAGVIDITAGGDAITAQTEVVITGGEFTLSSGGGSNGQIDETSSAKGIKATVNVTIEAGTFTIDAADDAIHSNGALTVNGGAFSISTGDDGMHADSSLEINAGEIEITESYEGLESALITINGGDIQVVSSDDGINVAGGTDGSGMMRGMGPGGGQPPAGGAGQEVFTYSGDYLLYINGGSIVVDAAGDGIDVNGAIEMTGGSVLVNGPTEQMNGALDYDATFNISGGYLAAAGSAGMAQAPSESSSQYAALIYFSATLPAGTLVHIQNSAGEEILTFAPTKDYQSILFSAPGLVNGETYNIYAGGSSTGTASDGLYQGGIYTPGEAYTSFTISETVTWIGSGGMNRPMNRP